ncbi:hypothetical protein ACFW2I_09075 [Streptomyces nigra]|uniref:hypothetical protein n=1 Tax=Streptomyces nigra TaxID=1827580 RepID=UPI0036B0730B
MTTNPTDGPIHTWFGLSYCNYQVLHRTLMQSMPIEWQERMVACLEELREAFEHVPQPEGFKVEAATFHEAADVPLAMRKQTGLEVEYGQDAEGAVPVSYWLDGQEIDADTTIPVPAVDPVPHYNRGRTYIAPAVAAAVPAVPTTTKDGAQ